MRPILQNLQPTHAASMPAPGATNALRVPSILALALVLAAAAFVTRASAPPSVHAMTLADKQAQAAELDREVGKVEGRYDDLQERWRGAQFELDKVRTAADEAHGDVLATQRDLAVARRRLATRASVIYRTGGGSGDFAELASAGSVTAFFDRIETIRRVGDQDADVLGVVETLNVKVARKERALKQARARSAKALATATAAKVEMGAVLDERQAKLDSVNADIQAIMEEQRRIAAAVAAAAARETAALARVDEAPSASDGATEPSSGESSAGSSGSDAGGGEGDGGSAIPLPPASGSASSAASAAMSKLGSPYVWAAAGPDTFDCSGLVMWAFAQAGRGGMPHSTYVYRDMGVDVPLDQLQVGDLVFGSGDGHMGIYVGGGSFVHAPRSGDVVKVTSMSDYTITHARRV